MNKICHIISMDNIDVMGEITRQIYYNCIGDHFYHSLFNNEIPFANIYILHCFKKHNELFINFKRPYNKSKIISIVHSSEPCFPAKNSDLVITISDTWHDRLIELYGINNMCIYAGLDESFYKKYEKDFSKPVISRMSRPQVGKYHKLWPFLAKSLLSDNKNLSMRIKCKNYKNFMYIDHKRVNYIDNIQIFEYEKKIKELSKSNIFAMCHDTENVFVDTFCLELLEHMATGHACVIIGKYQPAIKEVIGKSGIICDDIEEWYFWVDRVVKNKELRESLALKAYERSKKYTADIMVNSYNEVIKWLV